MCAWPAEQDGLAHAREGERPPRLDGFAGTGFLWRRVLPGIR